MKTAPRRSTVIPPTKSRRSPSGKSRATNQRFLSRLFSPSRVLTESGRSSCATDGSPLLSSPSKRSASVKDLQHSRNRKKKTVHVHVHVNVHDHVNVDMHVDVDVDVNVNVNGI